MFEVILTKLWFSPITRILELGNSLWIVFIDVSFHITAKTKIKGYLNAPVFKSCNCLICKMLKSYVFQNNAIQFWLKKFTWHHLQSQFY